MKRDPKWICEWIKADKERRAAERKVVENENRVTKTRGDKNLELQKTPNSLMRSKPKSLEIERWRERRL